MKKTYVLWSVAIIVVIGLLMSGRFLAAPPATPEEAAGILTVVPDDHSKGNPNAPVTLIEYLDFECEACGAYYPVIKQLASEFPDDLRIVTRYFPLPGHRNGLPAALAVEAAAQQGKYWEMHDILYENQRVWGEKAIATPDVFEAYAQEIGLDIERFKRDVASESTLERVNRDLESGDALGNQGTPSFFLNGQRLPNPRSFEEFRQLIQEEIDLARSLLE